MTVSRKMLLAGLLLLPAALPAHAQQPGAGTAAPPAASPTLRPYRINPGDQLEIYVWGEERLQRDMRVLPDGMLAVIRDEFDAGRADETETDAAIRAAWREAGDLIDPHTAVALAVADRDVTDGSVPNIVLSTAHAAKFPDAVEAACGVRPTLPPWLDGLMTRPERIETMNNDQAEVERFVLSVSRAAKSGVEA